MSSRQKSFQFMFVALHTHARTHADVYDTYCASIHAPVIAFYAFTFI